jgi:exodeoxyribonuclease VII large subunit
MTESPELPGALTNLPEFTVSELSSALRRTVEETYGRVRVKGEISGFKRAASGHLYFSLKDEDAVLDAVCWRGQAGRLEVAPDDGLEVVCTGRITTYPGRSKYQIVIEAMELAGVGALLKMLEERKKRLEEEGLFDPSRKRPLPFLPDVIGVVTSPTGAVIRDILHRLADRYPRHVLLWPALVQGEGAAEQVAAAITGFNRLEPGAPVPRPDLLVVVRAAAASLIPLISAVGHETDTTLIDFAADVRAPTPSAAAEMAVPVRAELLAQLLDDAGRMMAAIGRIFNERCMRIDGLARGLPDLRATVEERTRRLDDWAERLANALPVYLRDLARRLAHAWASARHPREQISEKRQRLAGEVRVLRSAAGAYLGTVRTDLAHTAQRLAAAHPNDRLDRARLTLDGLGKLLESVSYRGVLGRGFVLARDAGDEPVTSAAGAKPGAGLTLTFHDGEAGVTVDGSDGRGGGGKAKRAGRKDARQGRLL